MEPTTPALDDDDDDNPFAYQPPSPSRAPSITDVQDLAIRYPAQTEPTRFHSITSHRMGLSSIPFAPPTFVEPTYEDHYQDMTMPLNDFDYDYGPEVPTYLTERELDDRDSGPVLSTPITAPQFASPQQISSPLFSSDGYPPSLIATTSGFNNMSSDDIALPTSTHFNILSPETDDIQDALRANHPFVTSMYASSSAGSFRGLPLDAMAGSRESSPHGLVSTSRGISTPEGVHHQVWTPRKEVLPQGYVQPRPASSDIYKSKLLAYATAVADHMSSSGDEGLVRQQANERVDPPETVRAVVTRSASSLGLPGEKALTTLLEPSGRSNDQSAAPGLYMNALDPDSWMKPKLAKSLATGGLEDCPTGAQTTATPELGAPNSGSCDIELYQTNLDDNFDLEDTYLEDWENKPQSQGSVDNSEKDEPLVSEYEVMQTKYDALAADEPSDDENGPAEQQVTIPQQGYEIEHSVPEVGGTISTMPEPLKRTPRIQPFPMKISRHCPDTTTPGEDQPVLTKLSPKFVSQPTRYVRPSPFAALLKKRFKDRPNAVMNSKGWEDMAAVEGREDEIESWSG
ncbi:unnamed protein product [Rhizoctonia solani]|uniref:Uncharacterized protein n=1 Tax=Rhizoctonia solani TaxID=456999 RepID=A0A8H3H9X3_9AGAM|nr:unnamed protein product [Rhizoctonia solani]